MYILTGPAQLPTFLGAASSFFGLIASFLYLPESLPRLARESDVPLATAAENERLAEAEEDNDEKIGEEERRSPLEGSTDGVDMKLADENIPMRPPLTPSGSRSTLLEYERKTAERALTWWQMLTDRNTRIVVGIYCVIAIVYGRTVARFFFMLSPFFFSPLCVPCRRPCRK